MIGLMRHIKMDPNPRGEENFLFINALNEWGEGNVLEPSAQWGDAFSKALRGAVDYAATALPWADDLIRQGEELEPEVQYMYDDAAHSSSSSSSPAVVVDVCVIVRDFAGQMPWTDVWQLSHTLWSLQAQHNPRWRAVVVPVGEEAGGMRGIETQVLDTYDPRIQAVEIPQNLRSRADRITSDVVTDWVVKNIAELSPSCGKATYMLVTNATTTYEPHTFDVASRKRTDIIGLNFMSRKAMELQNAREGNLTWNQRCSRYSDSTPLQLCQAMLPEHGTLDISAALVNLARWRKEGHLFRAAAEKFGDSVGVLAELEKRRKEPWTWSRPTSAQCDVIQADTYLSCTRTGHLWFDAPDEGGFHSGCYSGSTLQWTFGDEAIPTHWDYGRFKQEDPYCVRLSEQRYEDVLTGIVILPSEENADYGEEDAE